MKFVSDGLNKLIFLRSLTLKLEYYHIIYNKIYLVFSKCSKNLLIHILLIFKRYNNIKSEGVDSLRECLMNLQNNKL